MHRLWAALMRTYAVPRLLQGGASSGAAGAQGTGAGQLFGPQDVGAVTMIVYACARMGHKDAGLLKLVGACFGKGRRLLPVVLCLAHMTPGMDQISALWYVVVCLSLAQTWTRALAS